LQKNQLESAIGALSLGTAAGSKTAISTVAKASPVARLVKNGYDVLKSATIQTVLAAETDYFKGEFSIERTATDFANNVVANVGSLPGSKIKPDAFSVKLRISGILFAANFIYAGLGGVADASIVSDEPVLGEGSTSAPLKIGIANGVESVLTVSGVNPVNSAAIAWRVHRAIDEWIPQEIDGGVNFCLGFNFAFGDSDYSMD
jgi:hypothetical protein